MSFYWTTYNMNAATLIFFGVKLQMKNLIIPWFKKTNKHSREENENETSSKSQKSHCSLSFFPQFWYFEDPIHANGK